MTFNDLVNQVVRNVYPDKVPLVLMPRVRDWIRDALIELQTKCQQLRVGNIQFVNQESTYFYCGQTVFDAPQGWISRVAITHRDVPSCQQSNAICISKPEMQSLSMNCSGCSYPEPVNPTKIGPLGFRIPDATMDRIQAVTYRKASFFDGRIWFFPWINSNETVVVEWKGQKKSWDGTDPIPKSFLDEQGGFDREIQMLIELYVTANRQMLESCTPKADALGLYSARLARFLITKHDMAQLDIDEPWPQACSYRSPALVTDISSQWDRPIITCTDVSRWDPPIITSEDYDDPIIPVASIPVITPNVLTFAEAIMVTITSGTPMPAEIRFTIDGSAPGPSSTLYTAPFFISGTTRIRAISIKAGYVTSGEADRTYTLVVPTTNPVTFTPTNGNFAASVSVALATTTPFPYQIRYTLDGSSPISGSAVYSTPIVITASTLVRAVVVKSGYNSAPVDQKQYTKVVVPKVAPVEFIPTGSTFIDILNVVLTCSTPGSAIYYTIDGSTPTVDPLKLYTGAITLTATKTIKAIAAAPAFTNSDMTQQTYTYLPKTAPVVYTPLGGSFIGTQSVALSCATPGSVIHYTTNNTLPTAGSPVYSAPIALTATTTIRAVAITAGYGNSDTGVQVYTLFVPQLPPVTYLPTYAYFAEDTEAILSCATPGSTIHYTTDGSIPVVGGPSTMVYSAPIPLVGTTTIKAIATKLYYATSLVSVKMYTKLVAESPQYVIDFDTSGSYSSLIWVDRYDMQYGNHDWLEYEIPETTTHVSIRAVGFSCHLNVSIDGYSATSGLVVGTPMITDAVIGSGPGTYGDSWFHFTVPLGTKHLYFDGYFITTGEISDGIGFDIYLS